MANDDFDHFGTPVRPRDYGVVLLTRNKDRLFLSPARLAMGTLMTEPRHDVRQRLEDVAQREDIDTARLVRRTRSRGGAALLREKNPIEGVDRYGKTIVAKIRGRALYRTSLTIGDQEYSRVSCTCPDSQWTDVKGVEYELCKHASLLHASLEQDIRERTPFAESRSGLMPRHRFAMRLPLDVREWDLSDVLGRYACRQSTYEISSALLERVPSALEERVHAGNARYAVLRQSRPEGDSSRLAGALRNMERNLRQRLRTAEYIFDGYARELVGTEFESVGIRFRQGDQRAVLCFSEDRPPLVVQKSLREYTSAREDPSRDLPLAARLDWHESLDDATRRTALTRVVIPGYEIGESIPVSKELKTYMRSILDA